MGEGKGLWAGDRLPPCWGLIQPGRRGTVVSGHAGSTHAPSPYTLMALTQFLVQPLL